MEKDKKTRLGQKQPPKRERRRRRGGENSESYFGGEVGQVKQGSGCYESLAEGSRGHSGK